MATLLDKGLAIQREYAQKRKRALNKRDEEKIKLVKEAIARLATKDGVWLDALAAQRNSGEEGWEIVYDRLIGHLQGCDLTINLEAANWFGGGPNNYQTYATTYQKNMVTTAGGKQALKTQKDATGKVTEDADVRMYADEKVTLPDNWRSASLLHPQRRRLAKAMSTTKGSYVADLKKADLQGDQEGFEVNNRRFNPNAKQVFAALNYGRRVHGASVNYGYSHLILKPALKRNAIYFPADTFSVAAFAKDATRQQCTYETLGAVLAYCDPGMARDIWNAGYKNQRCEDTAEALMLLEAHVFDEVRIDRDVEALVLARRTKDTEIDAQVWETVKTNAREWARRNNVRLLLLSA